MKANRPTRVTLAVIGVLSIAALNLLRFVQAIQQWDFLASLPGASPLYITLTGLLWFVTGLPLGLALWFGINWGRLGLLVWAPAYVVYAWFDRLFVSSLAFTAWPFWLFMTVLILGLVYRSFTRGKGRAFFRREA
jgi:hypothetical protein